MASKRSEAAAETQRAQEGYERFNLATMSGVFPGTRTATYQRVQVEQDGARLWLQLLWYDEPPRVVAYRLTGAETPSVVAPFVELAFADPSSVYEELARTLQHNACAMRVCGSCSFWQPTDEATAEHLPIGDCSWQADSDNNAEVAAALPAVLRMQAALAPACRNWQAAETERTPRLSAGNTRSAPPTAMRRAAEDAEIRQPIGRRLWRRWQRWLGQRHTGSVVDNVDGMSWAAALVERSGVGAGTEPCLTCQGRIANLGALTVATEEDDKQTFSVWRCRNCYALYLNNWVDRWERLDNLETEESYYRIAPQEASYLLTQIHTHQGGEHPNRRHERNATRQRILDFLNERTPLSHQIRQGR